MKFFVSISSVLALATSVSAAAVDIAARDDPAPTLTDTFAPVPTGCAGLVDRQLFSPNSQDSNLYQIFCFSQPGGYASIPETSQSAYSPVNCAENCDSYNSDPDRQYTCHAALFTTGDNHCQLLWQANGNISPRGDSHYVVAHDF